MILRLHHTGFVVRDVDKALAFYRDVVGLELVNRYQRTGPAIGQVVGYEEALLEIANMESNGDHILELIQYVSPPPGPRPTEERSVLGGTHLCMLVDDIDETFRNLTDNGAVGMNPPASVAPGRRACYMQDPDGNWIELLELSG